MFGSIRFGGPGKWIYTDVGGIDQTEDSIGFEHIVLRPPSILIEQALAEDKAPPPLNSTTSPALRFATASYETLRGTIAFQWALPTSNNSTTCAEGGEGQDLKLACPGSTISTIIFGDYGTPQGSCSSGFTKGACTSNKSMDLVSSCCVGKPSCGFSCSGGSCTCDGGAQVSLVSILVTTFANLMRCQCTDNDWRSLFRYS